MGLSFKGARAPSRPSAGDLRRAAAAAVTRPFTFRSDLGGLAGHRDRPLTFGRRDGDAMDSELYSYLEPLRQRIWLQRAFLLLFRSALLAAGWWLVVSFLRFAAVDVASALATGVAIGIVAIAGVLIAAQSVTFADAARVADRRLGLSEQLGTAVELTRDSRDGRLARLQTRRASDLLLRIDPRPAVRFSLPIRDLRLLAAVSAAALLFTYLATLNLSWPGQLIQSDLVSDPDAEALAAAAPVSTPIVGDPALGDPTGGFDPQLLDPSLSSSAQQLASQNLSPEEMSQRLADLQAGLAERAAALERSRQALGDLANALADNSATSDAANSLRRGDYQKAADQLAALGKQSAQLSAAARRDLAARLNQGASTVAPNNADLAGKMRQAAQDLGANDAQRSAQSLGDLAQSIAQAGAQASSLADPSQPFDPSQAPAGDGSAAPPSDGAAGDPGATADGAAEQAGAPGDQASAADGQGDQAGQPGDQAGGQPGDAAGAEGAAGDPSGAASADGQGGSGQDGQA